MGPSAYWTETAKAVSFPRTGRSLLRCPGLEPQESDRESPSHRPPSDGLSHCLGSTRSPEQRSTDRLDRMVRKVLLASPRGYCAGVERAVDTVEKALELYGPPVYVRKQIVHNLHVVRELEARGAIFVEDEDEVPVGRDGRLLGARRRAVRARELGGAQPAHARRDVPARDEGAHAGAALRGPGLHRDPDRPRGPRGGRRHDGRGAGPDRARRDAASRSRRSTFPEGDAARLRHADDAVGRRDAAR